MSSLKGMLTSRYYLINVNPETLDKHNSSIKKNQHAYIFLLFHIRSLEEKKNKTTRNVSFYKKIQAPNPIAFDKFI